jgi:hypothetical protein
MDGNRQHRQELVALSTAAAFVYKEIMGITIERMEVPQLNQILHDVAHALSHVAPIYGAISATETAKPLPALTLMHGAFTRGATVLRTSSGVEYRRLSIQRGHMRAAVTILRASAVRFVPSSEPKNKPS